MKVIYFSSPYFADCDFPLVGALQNKGIDVQYYIPLPRNFQHASILEFKKPLRGSALVKAASMEDMQIYRDCIDLDRLYLIKGFPRNKFWLPSWCLWLYTLWHMRKQNADIIHVNWQFNNHFENFLFKFAIGKKKIMTVHDPIMHYGFSNADKEEIKRIRTFNWANHLILLNTTQSEEFMERYSIPQCKISYSRLPQYDIITKIKLIPSDVTGNYILFFGYISPYKGLECLLETMEQVHIVCPHLKLVIAGGGKLYFDVSKYMNLDYIVWIHRYIGIRELAGLLKSALFVVCPYKNATQSGVVQTSFAMGIPVVTTNVGSFREDVVEGVNGKLIPSCNSKILATAIISLYNNPEQLISMRENLMSNKTSSLVNSRIADDYIKIYNFMVD